ncbi:MAG: hypothetical protein AMS22_15490 [Thiotrichales bacterium SG8_50]|nr:MAG: hypothetical protein AMS22_15490 [Thiotrichales bacterium SG8_50]
MPTPKRLVQALVGSPETLSGWVPHSGYDHDNKLFYIDGELRKGEVDSHSHGFTLEGYPQTGANEELARIIRSIITVCPAHTGLQITLYASPNLIKYFKRYSNLRQVDPDQEARASEIGRPVRNENIYRTLSRRAIQYYQKGTRRSLFRDENFCLRNFRLIISVVRPGLPEEDKILDTLKLRDSIRGALKSAYIPNEVWDVNDYLKYMTEVLNPSVPLNDFYPQYDDGRELKAQIVKRDTLCRVSERGLTFTGEGDPVEVRNYSVLNYPQHVAMWDMANLIGDQFQTALQYPCPFQITTGIWVGDSESMKQRAMMKSARATSNAESPLAKVLPDLQEKKRDWDLVLKSISQGGTMVSLYHQFTLFAPPDVAQAAEESLMAIARTRNFELTNDQYMQIQSLLNTLPMTLSREMYADMKKARRVTTKTAENAIHMAPLVADHRGSINPVMMLYTRRGQVFGLDLFDKQGGNYNAAIVGRSGSGKSVFMGTMALSYLATGAQVFMIDIGKSYQNLCRLVDGNFIMFTPESDINLNLFSLVEDIDEEMDVLKPLISQMAMPDDKPDSLINSEIEQAIRVVWDQKGKTMTVSDIADYFDNKGRASDPIDQRLIDFANMLFPYTSKGRYGKYFHGECNIDFNKQMTVLELEELSTKKDLQGVVLLILMYAIQQRMYLGDRKRKKVLFIDESWDLMGRKGAVSDFIKHAYKRVRKYGGSAVSGAQSLTDYLKTEAGQAALENSDWKFIMSQQPEVIDSLEREGGMSITEPTKRLLKSLRTSKGKYSEVFVYSDEMQAPARLVLDPYTLLMCSTQAEDYEAIREKTRQGLSMAEALDAVILERGQK